MLTSLLAAFALAGPVTSLFLAAPVQSGIGEGGTKTSLVYTHELTHVAQQKIRVRIPDPRVSGDKSPIQATVRFLDASGRVLYEQRSTAPRSGNFVFELAPDARKLKPGMVIKIDVNCTVAGVAKVDALTWKMKGVDDKLEGSVELVDARSGDVTSRRQMAPRRE